MEKLKKNQVRKILNTMILNRRNSLRNKVLIIKDHSQMKTLIVRYVILEMDAGHIIISYLKFKLDNTELQKLFLESIMMLLLIYGVMLAWSSNLLQETFCSIHDLAKIIKRMMITQRCSLKCLDQCLRSSLCKEICLIIISNKIQQQENIFLEEFKTLNKLDSEKF